MVGDLSIQEIAKGNYAAFKALHNALSRRIYYFVLKLTNDAVLSEDIVQEAFILYWERKASFSSMLAVKSFLYSTVKNKALKSMWMEKNQHRILESIEWETVIHEDQLVITAEICATVKAAIAKLPEQTRRIIELSMQDMTVEQVAAELEVSPNTVKSLKKTGYKFLREQLKYLNSFLFFFFS